MKTKQYALLATQLLATPLLAVIILFVLTGCGDSPLLVNGKYSPDDVYVPPPSDNTAREDATGAPLELDPHLAVFAMGDVDTVEPPVPTNDTLGRYADDDLNEGRRGKYIITGPAGLGTSALSAGGFVDTFFLYCTEPIDGYFRMRARIRITKKQGDSTSKGYLFGMFAGEDLVDSDGNHTVRFSNTTRGGGMMFRSSDNIDSYVTPAWARGPAIRPYYYKSNNSWGTGGTAHDAADWMNCRISGWSAEVILEFKRTEDGLTLSVFNSKTGLPYPPPAPYTESNTTLIPAEDLSTDVAYGQRMYAGLALFGTSVEFSEFTLWTGEDEAGEQKLIETPLTNPAYVPVEGVRIGISPAGNSTVNTPANHASRPFTSEYSTTLSSLTALQLVPVFEPVWADNTNVEWTLVSWNGGAPAGQVQFVDVAGSNRKKITAAGPGTALIMMNSRDLSLPPLSVLETLADWSLELTITN